MSAKDETMTTAGATPWEKARAICERHNREHPDMPNVPLQTVFEWLLEVQGCADLVTELRVESDRGTEDLNGG